MTAPFALLFVCTGNRFRSPLAAAFVDRLTLGLPVVVSSAGTMEIEGVPALEEAVSLAASCGVDLSSHRSRRLRAEDVRGADLLIGFEQIHVRHAIVDAGAARERAFTLGELVELLAEPKDVPEGPVPVRARALVARADERRRAEAPRPAAPEIADPYGRRAKVYRQTAVEVQRLSVELSSRLFGVPGDGVVPLEARRKGA